MRKKKKAKRNRSAETGEFVTKEFAEKNPRTTVSERVKKPKQPEPDTFGDGELGHPE